MFLTTLPKIRKIESHLQEMQRDITVLYEQRQIIIENGDHQLSPKKQNVGMINSPQSARQIYNDLAAKWGHYNIKLPAFQNLQLKLTKATKVITQLSSAHPELVGKLDVILVPPTRILTFPVSPSLRMMQDNNLSSDTIYGDLPARRTYRQWRVLVVYTGKQGLYLGTPEEVLKETKYLMAGLNTLKLGHVEYAALSLQQPHPLDKDVWTVLYKDYDGYDEFIPCAGFINGRYRFELVEINTVFGSDRFRPAVEVV